MYVLYTNYNMPVIVARFYNNHDYYAIVKYLFKI